MPKPAKDCPRPFRINTYLSKAEVADLQAVADLRGITTGAYLRGMLTTDRFKRTGTAA